MDNIYKKEKKHCIRSYSLTISNSEERYIYISVPGIVKEIHLINFGIHKFAS